MFMDGRRKFLLFLVVASCQLVFAPRSGAADDIVTIDSGMLKGERSGTVVSFKGIPYAAPPVGDLRWRNPRPAEEWSGIRDARDFGPSCMQTDDLPKSEDCLTLNVWTPAKRPPTPMPVMVWIYGGALVHGNTVQYPGAQLAARKVVFVSMNYRMGRLGYFAHPALMKESADEPVGNYGYMDQLAALKWVRQNIDAFGGDPKKVTIFGQSAGGGSVMAHMISPLSLGLFRGAILQSPGLPTARAEITPLSPLKEAEKTALDYAASLRIHGSDADALTALRALPAEKLTEGASAQEVLAGMATGKPVIGISGPMIDGRFLLETPEAAFAASRQAPVPVIIGANDRGLGLGQAATKDDLFALFGSRAAEARSLYDPSGQQSLDELKQQVLADRTLVEPSRHLADEIARTGQPTWWYRFSYVAEALRDDPTWKGAPHGAEIPYIFDMPNALVKDGVTPADWAMATLASAYWMGFAANGDPNGGSRPKWPNHNAAVDRVVDFTNLGVKVGADPLKLRLDLWQSHWEEKK
ncbi:UNVERIFIED_ORG: para-nitrobenzyl esterase [Rhizobium etli]|uniref:carboxylesterase/lipase family protein n=1 Tax=Rhizobium sp. Kim5 TaxID=2020311 RepID=UPI00031008B0|nr:carboxylesterase family protein [Rhizobium sp. Kim5]